MRQMRVVVMLQMQIAIDGIWKPHGERRKAEQPVDERRACRMAVQQFVLQRHVPCAEQREQRQRNAQSERLRMARD
jgi:hypothetical protein